MQNMLLFAKFSEAELNQLGNTLKAAIEESAVLACDSHPTIGKAEFSVLCMKFCNNQIVKKAMNYIDKKVGKMIDFD